MLNMAFRLTKDFFSVTDLKRNTKKIFKRLHESGQPLVLTHNGKPDAILIDAAVFEDFGVDHTSAADF